MSDVQEHENLEQGGHRQERVQCRKGGGGRCPVGSGRTDWRRTRQEVQPLRLRGMWLPARVQEVAPEFFSTRKPKPSHTNTRRKN